MQIPAQNQCAPTNLQVTTDIGICAGTRIMTRDGEIPIEHLTAGDRLITRDCGIAVLLHVTSRPAVVQPILIRASTLGYTRPNRDMLVTPDTLIHLCDWRAQVMFGAPTVNIAARRLVDGEFMTVLPPRLIHVYAIALPADHIIYADGVELVAAAA